MTKTFVFFAGFLLCAASAAAQSNEFGVIFGGTKRSIDSVEPASGTELLDDGFSLSNGSVDLYYGFELDPRTWFKIRLGRMEVPVSFREVEVRGPSEVEVRRDFEGEVQHVEGVVEYRFSEPFGSTGLYAGVGAYRQEAEDVSSTLDYGFVFGVTGDFPLSRRYGVLIDAAYHATRADFGPRYLTIGAGLRIAF